MTRFEEITTARDCHDVARDEGFGPLTTDLVVRATARNRHSWRVEQTLQAAREWARKSGAPEGAVGAILRLDLAGVGGQLDAEGVGTDRMPAFVSLGKGRWHASDGGAWRAAAEAALVVVGQSGYMVTTGADGRCYLDYYGEHDHICLLAALAPARWLRAEATRAALHAAGVGSWEPALSWSDGAVEAALQESEWAAAEEDRQEWLRTAERLHPAEFRFWQEAGSEDDVAQRVLEVAMGTSLPEGWPADRSGI